MLNFDKCFFCINWCDHDSFINLLYDILGFPGTSAGKELACNMGDLDINPGLGKAPEGGHGYPLWYSCLENPVDEGAWQVTIIGLQRIGHTKAT